MERKDWNVLLVDDEREFVTTLSERLGLRGIASRVVFDGESALREVAENPPHLVILDVMLPGMRGLEVLRGIRAGFPNVKVILLTGHGTTKNGIEGMKLGAFDYMIKPLDIDVLIEKMTEAAGGRR
ncbi:response regulator [Desulfovibrio sulfodismutans]|uniref:Response regulator n=1 Tax=Desulfolutivibrio sulfodismutans TaxID=63561 RepID=A0A7K3NJ54_9BACT|nr:response regulator [Desulfolutivibrio sulfodismutans]NDY56236.1 response regulator [Desulfolutivibrio sulfodismutans]QLA11294.1 response regulator [Desulfolutivibrio sulfodismutans DSM 3696]